MSLIPDHDVIGYWSEVKLEIIRDYAKEYTKILAANRGIRKFAYVDGFAGPGLHFSRTTEEFVPGSPLNALNLQPQFSEYHFIDMLSDRTEQILLLAPEGRKIFTYAGDCNQILPLQVFPRVRYEDYARALCLLDPYNIDLSWEVVEAAGRMRSVEIFLNFMIMDMNMNALPTDPEKITPAQSARMDRFWGDGSWRQLMYHEVGLFGWEKKTGTNEILAEGYRQRLKDVAGFAFVPKPIPMRNDRGATVYYLFFASPNRTGNKIVEHIFEKHRNRGAA